MTNKDRARAYFRAVNAYDAAAIELMVEEGYIQHNPYLPTGRAAFLAFLPKLKVQGARIQNLRILEDGPFIIMHHEWKNALAFGQSEMVAFHIIRFNAAGLIAEHWNVMTGRKPLNPSGRSQTDGAAEIREPQRTLANKALIVGLFDAWLGAGRGSPGPLLRKYFHPDFHEHHPDLADGIAAMENACTREGEALRYGRVHKVFGEGNFVLAITEGTRAGRTVAAYELFRLESGRIAERWNITQEVPSAPHANKNTMFGF